MSEELDEFLDMFRDEANERLDAIVTTLLEIEAGRAGQDAVDDLLRNAHTVKGNASMLGLADIATLAHAVEDVLSLAREDGALEPARVDPLLAAADALRRQVAGEVVDDLPGLIAALGVVPAAPAENGRPEEKPVERAEGRGIRVPAEKIDRLLDVVGETVMNRRRIEHVAAQAVLGSDGQELTQELDVGERLLRELKEAAIDMRTLPLASIAGSLPRAVRDIARAEGKEAELVISGGATELDRIILESLPELLTHLIRNAVGHGIESPEARVRNGKNPVGRIELHAVQRGSVVHVTLADDGSGVPPEVLTEARRVGSLTDVLTRAGFSTATEVSDLSGRGVGLDAVRRQVESFGGSLEVTSEPGRGTSIELTLPLALALLDVLLVERGGGVFGLPLPSVDEVTSVERIQSLAGRQSLELRGETVPFADLADVLGTPMPALPEQPPALIVSNGGRRLAVACDRLLGQEELVVKPLGALLEELPSYLGAAILGDSRIALLLDPAVLVRTEPRRSVAWQPSPDSQRPSPKLLVVEDSYMVRELQRGILEAAGYRIETAENGRDALLQLLADDDIELVLTDVEMPEMDGVELTRAIRATPTRTTMPVVILTSLVDDAQRQRGLEAGADAYMVKRSFDQGVLLDTVGRLVGA